MLFSGSCLCGHIAYQVKGPPIFPHLCSCRMCQKWSGAPTVAWVSFPQITLTWKGIGGAPSFFRSSEQTQRGFCPRCGGTLCALNEGDPNVAITIASLDEPAHIIPTEQHSYADEAPFWWNVHVAGKHFD
ncbi:MAG: GFA family protein [Alphaproteobacteria bacterium]|nr:GFA family protein [Alphaproteobacteria bacterium]